MQLHIEQERSDDRLDRRLFVRLQFAIFNLGFGISPQFPSHPTTTKNFCNASIPPGTVNTF